MGGWDVGQRSEHLKGARVTPYCMSPPVDNIAAPPFAQKAVWVNVGMLRMDKQRGRPVLVEFVDFCRVSSLRTLPYVKAWHERYADDGLRVVTVHSPLHAGVALLPDADGGGSRASLCEPGTATRPQTRTWPRHHHLLLA